MSGLWTVLAIVFAISFAMQSWFHFALLVSVAIVYAWFFNPSWKRKILNIAYWPMNKLKRVKYDMEESKRKKDVAKVFKNLKR